MKKPWTRPKSFQDSAEQQESVSAPVGAQAPSHDEIARRAYELFMNRGCSPGLDRQDWLDAERELKESAAAALHAGKSAAQAGLRSQPKDTAKPAVAAMRSAHGSKDGSGGLNIV